MATKNMTNITVEPGKQDIWITREFDAPRELVYKAFSDPDLYVQWLGPRGYQMKLETFEPRSGGSYRYIHLDGSGNEYGFHGVFHEFSPEQMVQTFEFEGYPGHVSLERLEFEDLPGDRTRITIHSIYETVADRDGMAESGMEKGVNEGYERLDELLEKLRVR